MTRLWEGVAGSEPRLQRWLGGQVSELEVQHRPRSAWAIVAGAGARACAERGKPLLVLVPGPDRFADELRMWLAGRPATHVSAEVGVSSLDRPPAFDEAVNRRLEALTALLDAEREPVVVVSSRRAITRQTISPHDLAESTVVLAPGRGPDPVTVAGRLVELGYSREPLVEERGQFSLRGGILDVFPAAADAPVRAEWSGDAIETLRLFDPENQRSVMAIKEAVVRTGRELLIGPDRGGRPRLAVTAAEGAPDAADLGWFHGEPLVGQPRALAGLAERGDGAAVVFATEQDERLRALLDAAKVGSALREIDLDVDLEVEPLLAHAAVDIAAGCSQPGLGFHLSTDAELFGRVRRPSRAGRSERTRKDELTSEFTLDFANDELVVHVDHGIARFKGMRLIESEGAHREYLELEYAEGDRLFVPVENLDRVQNFLGGESAPALHRPGTTDWTRARGRARTDRQDVADDLLKIYSMPEARTGVAFGPDTAWQPEPEASFPLEETPGPEAG